MTKAEQETIVRWGQEEQVAHLWTAYGPQARQWTRLGYSVRVFATTKSGHPQSWTARVPCGAIRFRRLKDGVIVRRQGHRNGRVFGIRTDQQVETDGSTR